MGNTPSVEAPRRATHTTHKLSKPRVGNHATTAAGLLSPNGFSSSSIARYSTSQLGGQLPSIYSPAPSPVASVWFAPVDAVPRPDDEQLDVPPPPPLKDRSYRSKRTSLFRSKSSQESAERRDRRSSTGLMPPSMADNRLGRANSMIYDEGANPYYARQTTERSESLHLVAMMAGC
jgi:hypothetical protein